MLTRMDDDPDRHLHSTVFQHLRKGLAQPLPKIGIVRDALVIDDDQQVVIGAVRSEEHTSELQSLMRISYAVFCLKKKTTKKDDKKYYKKTQEINTTTKRTQDIEHITIT